MQFWGASGAYPDSVSSSRNHESLPHAAAGFLVFSDKDDPPTLIRRDVSQDRASGDPNGSSALTAIIG
jgi:hypothetical protein